MWTCDFHTNGKRSFLKSRVLGFLLNMLNSGLLNFSMVSTLQWPQMILNNCLHVYQTIQFSKYVIKPAYRHRGWRICLWWRCVPLISPFSSRRKNLWRVKILRITIFTLEIFRVYHKCPAIILQFLLFWCKARRPFPYKFAVSLYRIFEESKQRKNKNTSRHRVSHLLSRHLCLLQELPPLNHFESYLAIKIECFLLLCILRNVMFNSIKTENVERAIDFHDREFYY